MKILVNIEPDPREKLRAVSKVDCLVIEAIELTTQITENSSIVFRGDDRKPESIFPEGFKKRAVIFPVKCHAQFDTSKDPKPKEADIFDPQHDPLNVARAVTYNVSNDEVAFRPQHMDLVPETCVSLTMNLALTPLFPLNQSAESYIYIVDIHGVCVLPTYKVQKDAGRIGLSIDSGEITCTGIAKERILGAIKIYRKISGGEGPSRIVQWEFAGCFANVAGTKDDSIEAINALMAQMTPFPELRDTVQTFRYSGNHPLNTAKLGSNVSKTMESASKEPPLKVALRCVRSHTNMVGTIKGSSQNVLVAQQSGKNSLGWL
jgi:hypothetical protein